MRNVGTNALEGLWAGITGYDSYGTIQQPFPTPIQETRLLPGDQSLWSTLSDKLLDTHRPILVEFGHMNIVSGWRAISTFSGPWELGFPPTPTPTTTIVSRPNTAPTPTLAPTARPTPLPTLTPIVNPAGALLPGFTRVVVLVTDCSKAPLGKARVEISRGGDSSVFDVAGTTNASGLFVADVPSAAAERFVFAAYGDGYPDVVARQFSANGGNVAVTMPLDRFASCQSALATSTPVPTAAPSTASPTATPPTLVARAIDIAPLVATLRPGQAQQFTATVRDQFGNFLSIRPKWSAAQSGSLPCDGAVDQSGLFTATATTAYISEDCYVLASIRNLDGSTANQTVRVGIHSSP